MNDIRKKIRGGRLPALVEVYDNDDELNPNNPRGAIIALGGIDFVVAPQELDAMVPGAGGQKLCVMGRRTLDGCPNCGHRGMVPLLVLDRYDLGVACCRWCGRYGWCLLPRSEENDTKG